MARRRNTRSAGDEGEALALQYLRSHGVQIVETNYRFERGEIDIIARDGEFLVFCEVKMRKTDEFGDPEYAIPPRKQRQIRRVALGYLFEREIRDQACRFDVVAIRKRGASVQINHIKNAF